MVRSSRSYWAGALRRSHGRAVRQQSGKPRGHRPWRRRRSAENRPAARDQGGFETGRDPIPGSLRVQYKLASLLSRRHNSFDAGQPSIIYRLIGVIVSNMSSAKSLSVQVLGPP